jgi:hypothetical protein
MSIEAADARIREILRRELEHQKTMLDYQTRLLDQIKKGEVKFRNINVDSTEKTAADVTDSIKRLKEALSELDRLRGAVQPRETSGIAALVPLTCTSAVTPCRRRSVNKSVTIGKVTVRVRAFSR